MDSPVIRTGEHTARSGHSSQVNMGTEQDYLQEPALFKKDMAGAGGDVPLVLKAVPAKSVPNKMTPSRRKPQPGQLVATRDYLSTKTGITVTQQSKQAKNRDVRMLLTKGSDA